MRAPPFDDFMEKRILRAAGKEVAIEVAGFRIEENEYRHRGFFRHGLLVCSVSRGLYLWFSPRLTIGIRSMS